MRRRGISTPVTISVIVLLAALVVGFAFVQDDGRESGGDDRRDLFAVTRGSFEITIPASGELTAMNQVEVRNRLESRAVIMEIVPEGKYVRKGELLLKLNDEELRNRIKDAEDGVKTAESQFIAAEANLAIRLSAAESEQDQAALQVELAELALRAWERGEVATRRKQLNTALETARINAERLEQRYEDSKHLYEQEFISADELKQDEIAFIEAQARLEQAELDIEVYNEYTHQQELKQKNSDLEQARAELERVKQRHAAELETARADVASKEYQLESRRERLAELEEQFKYCTVTAPTEGLVVYATSLESGRRGDDDPPQVGTELSRNELVMLLPDTSRMVAAVKVNEALSGLIEPGQRAMITSDAMPDTTFSGEVLSIGVLAESGGWRDPNRRDYTVRLLLTGNNAQNLRPSMRCHAEIFIDRVEDALYVPVQAVFREGRTAYVYVPEGSQYAPKEVTIGRSSELYVELTGGIEEGGQVLMRRPQPNELVRSARHIASNMSRGGAVEGPALENEPGADDDAEADALEGSRSSNAEGRGESLHPSSQRNTEGARSDAASDDADETKATESDAAPAETAVAGSDAESIPSAAENTDLKSSDTRGTPASSPADL